MSWYRRSTLAAVTTALLVTMSGCGGGQPPSPQAAEPASDGPIGSRAMAGDRAASSGTPIPTSSAPAAAGAVSEPAAALPEQPAQVWVSPFRFERVLEAPIWSLALGRSPYVAVLSAEPWMMDAFGWHELALPQDMKLQDSSGPIAIYFGRDDKPRVMGARKAGGDAWDSVYYRWRQGRWERDKREIGRLSGAPSTGLYGVLGDEDPEVVCKVGDVCIIKRRTGWKTIPAAPELHRVWVIAGAAYSIGDGGLARLQGDTWVELPWSFEGRGKESGFWVDQEQGQWVTSASQTAIYRGQAGRFTRMRSPVKAPSAIWGFGPSDVWVVGSDGVGHFDGTSWSRVQELDGSYCQVQGRGAELWVGGAAGVWRGTK